MIIVSNPGTHPEMMRLAGGLIDSGYDVRYLSSSSWSSESLIQRLAGLRFVGATGIATNLRRRSLPTPISRKHVKGIARWLELLVQVSMRSRQADVNTAIEKRNRAFQRGAVRFVHHNSDVEMIVGQYTASADIFAACDPSVTKILNYPIAHHRWLMRTMENEAVRNPRWSGLLQGHDFTETQLKTLDSEIGMADHILVPSSFAASTFLEFGVPHHKLSVIPLGCDLPPSKMSGIARATDKTLNLLFAGQATQRKGIGYLIEAVQTLQDVRLTIVGSCNAAARSLIETFDKVHIVPSLPRESLYPLMQEADLLVLPSLAEGFPLVAIEAMANGTPCLLSRATFAPDLISHGENGYVLNEVSARAIAEALRELQLDREGLIKAGLHASMTAKLYSWDNYSKNVSSVLGELHGRSSS